MLHTYKVKLIKDSNRFFRLVHSINDPDEKYLTVSAAYMLEDRLVRDYERGRISLDKWVYRDVDRDYGDLRYYTEDDWFQNPSKGK